MSSGTSERNDGSEALGSGAHMIAPRRSSGASHARILLVEDHDETRDVYAQVLRHYGYEVDTAANALTGIELARRSIPHLVLMDIGLPDMNGWEAARVLRGDALTAGIPLLAFSAYIDSSAELHSIDQHRVFDGFVVKPISPSELAHRIGQVLATIRRLDDDGAAA